MNDNHKIVAPTVDVAPDRIEIDIPNWSALESEERICLSCGVKQRQDGTIPCGH